METDIKKVCRKIGRDSAARGRHIDLAMSAGINTQHRSWIRQGYDQFRAMHSDRRAA